MRRIVKTLFLAGLVFAVLSGCSVDKGEPLPEVNNPLSLTMFQRLAMMALVRDAFQVYPDPDKLAEIPVEKKIPDTGGQPIFVSIFYKASPMIWGMGLEGTTHERLLEASAMIMRNPHFSKFHLVNRDKLTIKIDVLTKQRLTDINSDGTGTRIEPGVHGLVLQKGSRLFFQLPTDFITLGWEKPDYGYLDRKLRMLSEISRQAGVGGKGWRNYNVYRFRTNSFLQEAPDYAPLPLYRGNLTRKRFSMQEVQDAALRAGRHLLQNVKPNGRFRFEYDPLSNKESGFFYYDPTYHAAGLWALSVLFHYSKRLEIIEQTRPPLLWLVRHLKAPLMEPEASQIRFFGNAKTSAASMTLLALTAMPSLVIEELGTARVNRLAHYLTILKNERGRFFPTYYHKLFDFMPKKVPGNLDGLTVFALTRYYLVNPNIDFLIAAREGAKWQIEQFRKTRRADPWVIVAMYELWKIEKNDIYAKACFEMADELIGHQFAAGKHPFADYVGGFDNSHPPKTFSTAFRAHGINAAYNLAKDLDLDVKKYEDAVLRSTKFILTSQFNKQNSYFATIPDETLGAMRYSLTDSRVRLSTQVHAIVALCETFDVQLDILTRKRAEGKTGGWEKLPKKEWEKLKGTQEQKAAQN